MTVSALVLAPFAVAAAPSTPDLRTTGWLIVLGVVTTGGALVLFYELIRRVGAVRANLAGYLAPGLAIGYGAGLLDERVRARHRTSCTIIGASTLVRHYATDRSNLWRTLSLEAVVGLMLILSGMYMAGAQAPTLTR
jgi:drug/metabolite transporter (DMT)-like permease